MDFREQLMRLAAMTSLIEPPTPEELAAAPLLEGWSMARVEGDVGLALVGSVTAHPRLGDRPAIVTSELQALDFDRRWARTRSRVYRLGRPAWRPE